jgi:hypothetical protein
LGEFLHNGDKIHLGNFDFFSGIFLKEKNWEKNEKNEYENKW